MTDIASFVVGIVAVQAVRVAELAAVGLDYVCKVDECGAVRQLRADLAVFDLRPSGWVTWNKEG